MSTASKLVVYRVKRDDSQSQTRPGAHISHPLPPYTAHKLTYSTHIPTILSACGRRRLPLRLLIAVAERPILSAAERKHLTRICEDEDVSGSLPGFSVDGDARSASTLR